MKKYLGTLIVFIICLTSVGIKTEATSASSNGSVTIGPGSLTLTEIKLDLSYGKENPILIEAVDQTITKFGSAVITDSRGNNSGWHVQVKRSSDEKKGVKWDKHLSLDLQEDNQKKVQVNTLGFKNLLTQPAEQGYEVMQERPLSAILSIGKDVEPGEYHTTVIWNLQSGPEN